MTAYIIIAISFGLSTIWLSVALAGELRRKQEALDEELRQINEEKE